MKSQTKTIDLYNFDKIQNEIKTLNNVLDNYHKIFDCKDFEIANLKKELSYYKNREQMKVVK